MKNKQTVETNREPTTGVQTDTAPTRFEFESATVKSVCLAGTFNDWNPAATEMIPDGDGRWVKEMTVPPGAYEYLFVVDGEWVEDPRATESAPNPFNRNNSVVRAGERASRRRVLEHAQPPLRYPAFQARDCPEPETIRANRTNRLKDPS